MTSRLEILHNKTYEVFYLTRGSTAQAVIAPDTHVTIDVKAVEAANETTSELKIKIDVKENLWHENLIGKVRYQLDITKNHPLGGAQKLLISLFDTIFGQFLVVFGPL